MMQKEHMIKPEQDSKVEKPHLAYCCPRIEKKRKKTQNLHNTLQLNTMDTMYFKISPCLAKLHLAKVGAFFRHCVELQCELCISIIQYKLLVNMYK